MGNHNPGKSLPRDAVKLAEVVPKPTVQTRLDPAQTPKWQSPHESSGVPATHTRGDRKRGLGGVVCPDLTFPRPAPPPRTWHPRRRDPPPAAARTPGPGKGSARSR